MPVRRPNSSALVLSLLAAAVLPGCDDEPPPPVVANDQAQPDPGEALRPASERGTVPEDAHVVDYVIQARLDADAHRIEATETITWTNRSRKAVSSIPMHLYLNAFRANDTAWMRDGRLTSRTAAQGGDHPWGYIDVKSVARQVQTQGSEARPVPLSFAERDEPSLMDVELDEPAEPGQTVTLQLSFVTQLPRVFARSGYSGDFHMVAQWFPKPGVLDPDGQWHAHPFTFHSEFFADFGDYEVQLDVPYTMTVGATGVRSDAYTDGERRVLTYRAAMVHDFAWVAAIDLVEQRQEYDGISIRQLIPRARVQDGGLHLEMAAATLKHMEARFSPYPWSTLTIIHPPPHARGAGGMEYPTLFTTADKRTPPPLGSAVDFEERFSGRYVTTHELGHQWFQGLMASNEFDQPWLDEGLNSFSNLMVYFDHFADDTIAGEDVWVGTLAGNRFTMGDGMRLRSFTAIADVSDKTAADFSPVHGQYGRATYLRTASWMATLRAIAGRTRFDAAMRTYADRFRFRHPTGVDLEDLLVETLGRQVPLSEPDAQGKAVALDVRDFLHQALRSTAQVDFAVDGIEIVPNMAEPAAGFHRVDGELKGGDPAERPSRRALAEAPDDTVTSLIGLRRKGEFKVPVVVAFHTTDGVERRVWDGRARTITVELVGRRVQSVVIDPDGDLYLEGTRGNNTAFSRGYVPDRDLSTTVGQATQAAALAVMGGLGP